MDEKKLVFIIDVDGTICPIKPPNASYEDLLPMMDMVNRMRDYHKLGVKIILYTSRNMRTYNGNIGLINTHTAPVLLGWLERWDIPYDEIIFGKPWPGPTGFYVDDRAVRPREFLTRSPEQLFYLCKQDCLEENIK